MSILLYMSIVKHVYDTLTYMFGNGKERFWFPKHITRHMRGRGFTFFWSKQVSYHLHLSFVLVIGPFFIHVAWSFVLPSPSCFLFLLITMVVKKGGKMKTKSHIIITLQSNMENIVTHHSSTNDVIKYLTVII